MTLMVRKEQLGDHAVIRRVHELGFGQVDEANIVDGLRSDGQARVSLVAELDGRVVGHILFSDLPILTDNGVVAALSLAPMAVLPEHQRRGVGSALVERGIEACRDGGHRIVVVLGHSHFYPRFGFRASLAQSLASPFCGRDSWMALELVPGALQGVAGWVRYPPAFGIGVQVRAVYRPDGPEWARMRANLWPDEDTDAHAREVSEFFGTRAFGWSGAQLSGAVFVAERTSGGLCGFVECSMRHFVDDCATSPVGYVEGWYVDSDARRQGIGTRLIQAVERCATQHGCKELASDAHIENTASYDAHRASGLEETSRLVHFRKSLAASSAESSHAPPRLSLRTVAGTFAVCKLPSDSPIPSWATAGDVFSVTRTLDELSLVCREQFVPQDAACERDWGCLRVAGSMPFTLIGVLASLTAAVARAGIGVFAVSTFDTDYLFIQQVDMPRAIAALRAAGHRVEA
jgi:predicted N-acetyltransferase YhbS